MSAFIGNDPVSFFLTQCNFIRKQRSLSERLWPATSKCRFSCSIWDKYIEHPQLRAPEWPGGCLSQLLCIQCCLIAMEDLPKAGSTICTSQHKVHRLMAAGVLRTSQSSLTFLLTLGVGGLASTSSRLENICKRLSFLLWKEDLFVWLLLLCLWWCLILQRKEAAWGGLWVGWYGPGDQPGFGEIWRRMKLPWVVSFSPCLAKPILSICLLSWKWGGWQRCCCSTISIKWGSHLMGRWSTSGTRPNTECAPVTWTDKWCSAYLKCSLDDCQLYVTEELFIFGLMDTGVRVCVYVCVYMCVCVF